MLSGQRKKILAMFKREERLDIQLAIMQRIAREGSMDLPLLILEMPERGARAFHRFCWSCIAQVESRPAFIAAATSAPRGSLYLLLAALADLGNLPRLFLAAQALDPKPSDLYLAMCHACDDGVTCLQQIGAPSDMPPIRGPFLDSPLGVAARAGDRMAIQTMMLQMVDHGVSPEAWLSHNRMELPSWAYRLLKSVWTGVVQGGGVNAPRNRGSADAH